MRINHKSTPKVSIGMPVYNGEKYIREALDSLLAQTFTDFELIISDNASIDTTSVICQEYARKDSRICYIRQSQNKGAVANFKFVLDEAVGEYFMWAAHDDVWLNNHIEVLYQKHQLEEYILVASRPLFVELSSGNKFEFKKIHSELFTNNISQNYKNFLELHHWDYAKATMIYGLFKKNLMPSFLPISVDEELSWMAVGYDLLFLCQAIIKAPIAYIEEETWCRGERFGRAVIFERKNKYKLLRNFLYLLRNVAFNKRGKIIELFIMNVSNIYKNKFEIDTEFSTIINKYKKEIIELLYPV